VNLKRRKKISQNFPCECGHSKSLHDYAGPPIGEEWCNGLEYTTRKREGYTLSYPCQCMMYVPDNLKYLEQLSIKKKGKGKPK
jgi:hypothetical protein